MWVIRLQKIKRFDSFSHFLCPRVNRSCRSLLIVTYLKRDLSDLLLSHFTKEQPERFAQVAGNKRATVSHWLTLLFKKERKCDFLKNERIALLLFCSQKPMSEFPTLGNSRKFNFGPKSYWSLFKKKFQGTKYYIVLNISNLIF